MMTVQHSDTVAQEATEQAYIANFKKKTARSKQLFDKAQRVIP